MEGNWVHFSQNIETAAQMQSIPLNNNKKPASSAGSLLQN